MLEVPTAFACVCVQEFELNGDDEWVKSSQVCVHVDFSIASNPLRDADGVFIE